MTSPSPSSAAPFSIDYSPALLDGIRCELQDAFQCYRETGGVLFGHAAPGRIEILHSRPLHCDHAIGPGFVLSEQDQRRLAELISSSARDPQLAGLQALGWYHSHIASPIFLSERDLEIHSRYFPEPFQVALVVRLDFEKPARAGFFFRDSSGAMRTDSSYEEFTIRPSLAPTSSPSHTLLPRPLVCPKCNSRLLRSSRSTNVWERLAGLFGYYPFRCPECLSRALLKAADFQQRSHHSSRKRQAERRRDWLRTRRELLLWSGGTLGFLLILFYLVRDTNPKPDQP